MPRTANVLLSDANVLIDYLEGDLSVLRLVSRHIAPVYVLRPVFDEVNGLTLQQCKENEIRVEDAAMDALYESETLSS